MAATQFASLPADDEMMLDGDCCDFLGVPCLAGELELQVQSYETMSRPADCLTKDSGGSSFNAVQPDFTEPDYLENVSLGNYGNLDQTFCGRQSTADSSGGYASSRYTGGAGPAKSAAPQQQAQRLLTPAPPAQAHHAEHAQDSEHGDGVHHHAMEGESSGVGHGKGLVAGAQSEASEDNMQGAARARNDEEHMSMPSFGLSLSRLSHPEGGSKQQQAVGSAGASSQQGPSQSNPKQETAAPAITRAYSMGNIADVAADSDAAAAVEHSKRAAMARSHSVISPDTLPMDFHLGGMGAIGLKGRSISLNEAQLRKQWLLGDCDLLAPQLPPSVSELELLELPEDSIPVRPRANSLFSLQELGAAGPRSGDSGLTHFGEEDVHAGSSAPDVPAVQGQGGGMNVKRKIITSPSPLLAQKGGRSRHPGAGKTGAPMLQSPKRAKVGANGVPAAPWQAGDSAGVLAGWQPGPRGSEGAGGMKTVRSMPANMNTFLEGYDVSVRAPPGSLALAGVSPNSSAASASTLGAAQPFAQPFYPSTHAVGGAAPSSFAMAPPPVVGKPQAKSRAAVPPPPPQGMVPGMVPSMLDGKRPGMAMAPSVPKPRKRASPNGNPPKAPAPNPNGHCCTQCGTQTTPVWRAGPHGPKTLCNACGVRYMKVAKGNTVPPPRKQQAH